MGKDACLIVGGGHSDIPLILAAKRLGYHVITCGNRESDLGHCQSDEYHKIDFSDYEAVCQLARSLKIKHICACCNDFSALTCAYVAEKLDLPGHDRLEVATVLHHKDSFREFCNQRGILCPRSKALSVSSGLKSEELELRFPIIVKPVDLTGGKGISVATCPSELHLAIEKAFLQSRSKRVVIEEFIQGSRHAFSAILQNGKVAFHFLDNEHYYLNPFMVSAASAPTMAPADVAKTLSRTTENIARELKLVDGIVHIQFILHEGKPYLIELCRRAPGDLYVSLVEYACKVPYAEWIVKSAFGMQECCIKPSAVDGFYTRHCVMAPRNGRLEDVHISPHIETQVLNAFIMWRNGDIVDDYLTRKLAILFLRFQGLDQMLAQTAQMHELVKVKMF